MIDYSAKRGLAHEEFRLPPEAPDWARVVNGGVKPGHWAVQNPASTAGTQASAGRA